METLNFAFKKRETRECKITPEEYYLPFYGVGGSIREISKKDDGNYSVTRYDSQGKEVRCWDISPKKLRSLLIHNFYPNLEEYLKCNQERYQRGLQDIQTSKSGNIKDINKLLKKNNISKLMAMVSGVLFVTTLSFPVMITWTYSSVVLMALSITYFCATNDEIKDCRNKAFVRNYQHCEQILGENKRIFEGTKNRLTPTRFTGLIAIDENKTVGDRRVRVKTKDECI